jgi:hypothetical protein
MPQQLSMDYYTTGWDFRVAAHCRETPTPTAAELDIVRACDPAGLWTC